MTSNGSLVHDTPAMNGKADTSRVSQAVAATPEAARKTGEAVRRNPAPVAAMALAVAGAAAVLMRMRTAKKPQTRAQKVRAAVSGIPARMPSRKRQSMMSKLGKKQTMAGGLRSRLGMK